MPLRTPKLKKTAKRLSIRPRPVPDPTCAIAVGTICAILRFMHSPRVFSTHAARLPRGSMYILYGFLLLFSVIAGTAPVSAAEKAPARQRAGSPDKSVDSYTLTQRGDSYRITIAYPQVGNPAADAELAIWAREQASAFTDGIRLIPTPPPVPYELFITYETLKASSHVISVVFFISTSMGGAHPEPGMATFIYDKRDGRRLSYNDLFMTRDGIPEALSAICRKSLTEQLGDQADTAMLHAGTTPDMTNFDLFSLVRNGIRIYFPPYQAAPYSEGYLNVTIPLSELADFSPHAAFWDAP